MGHPVEYRIHKNSVHICTSKSTYLFGVLLTESSQPSIQPEVFSARQQRIESIELRAIAETPPDLLQLCEDAVALDKGLAAGGGSVTWKLNLIG